MSQFDKMDGFQVDIREILESYLLQNKESDFDSYKKDMQLTGFTFIDDKFLISLMESQEKKGYCEIIKDKDGNVEKIISKIDPETFEF